MPGVHNWAAGSHTRLFPAGCVICIFTRQSSGVQIIFPAGRKKAEMKNFLSQSRPVLQRMYNGYLNFAEKKGRRLFEDYMQNVVKYVYARNEE
jgi:hypothetical protein